MALIDIIRNKPRFILVDPSFDGKTGDKWQYAVSFLDSAARGSYEFILLAHEASPSIASATQRKVDQRNVFKHNFYSHGAITQRHCNTPKRQAAAAHDAECNADLAKLDGRIAELLSQSRFVEAERTRAKRTDLLTRHLVETAAREAALAQAEPIPTPFNRDDFALTLAAQLREIKVRRGDVLFMHTATQAMLESLSEIALHLDEDEIFDIDTYFLLHFGAEAPDARTFIDRYYSFSHMNSLGLRLRTGCPFRSLYLLATSAKLRDELEGQLQLPVGIFHGLTNLDRYRAALGGEESHQAARTGLATAAAGGDLIFGVRIADLDDARLGALNAGLTLLSGLGFKATLRLAYHAGNSDRAAAIRTRCDPEACTLVDTEDHLDYVRFLAGVTVMVLPYLPEVYRKRVSAVLHDCAVLGVSCIVPRHSTLEDGRAYADIFDYGEPTELPGAMLRAATALSVDPERSSARRAVAVETFASDVVHRLTRTMRSPSLTVTRRAPVAVVVMPAWGRVGSSYAIEGQIRYLLENNYFVIQVFVLDKAVDPVESASWLWRLLFENSQEMRGNTQRIAFRLADPSIGSTAADATGFDVYLDKMAANDLHDPVVSRAARNAAFVVVNHVFNSRFARKLGARLHILESHDIQSRQMTHWPLRNPLTGEAETFATLFRRELVEVGQYDFVVNVSEDEHAQLSLANPRSRVVTPYIPVKRSANRFESVGAMAHAKSWDPSYWTISRFDLLLVGDRHPANVESGNWFIREVFIPYLKPLGLNFAIVGRLSDALHRDFGSVGHIFYCGFVDDISEIRALSHLTVLPDRRGSGISIKTLETLAYGGAFVGTTVAFRGLVDRFDQPPPVFDDPRAFADRVIALLADRARRREVEDEARAMYDAIAGKRVFDAAWTEILSGLPVGTGVAAARASR